MWDIQLKTMNEKNKKNKQKLSYRDRGMMEVLRGRGVECMMTEGDVTLGSEHTKQYTMYHRIVHWKAIFFLLVLRHTHTKSIDLLFHIFIHSLVDSCECPDWGLNPTILAYRDDTLIELPCQDQNLYNFINQYHSHKFNKNKFLKKFDTEGSNNWELSVTAVLAPEWQVPS